MTTFDDVILISSKIQPIPMAEVEGLEAHLGFALPSGYREFITRFGAGEYCDLFRIYPPARIREEYAEHRKFWKTWHYLGQDRKEHWFFEGSEHILSEGQLQQSIIIGDSFDGDEFVYYPAQSDKVYELPRHEDKIHIFKADFSDLHVSFFSTPLLQTFIPWHERATLNFKSLEFKLDQATCLAKFQERWGSDGIIMLSDDTDAWSWRLIFFLLPVGGRVQILQDEGVTRTFTQDNGAIATVGGGGVRYIHAQIQLDEVALPELKAFLQDLQTEGLLVLLNN